MNFIKEWGSFVAIIVLIVLIRTFVITPVRVDGTSMYQTLDEGDILLLNKLDHTYERFEVVVFTINGEKLIKRIIGLPGEKVEFKNGYLHINGEIVEEKYGYGGTGDFNIEKLGYTVVPDNQYFLVGDNRNNSLDSRIFGCIKEENVIGSVKYVMFPFNKFGNIEK